MKSTHFMFYPVLLGGDHWVMSVVALKEKEIWWANIVFLNYKSSKFRFWGLRLRFKVGGLGFISLGFRARVGVEGLGHSRLRRPQSNADESTNCVTF